MLNQHEGPHQLLQRMKKDDARTVRTSSEEAEDRWWHGKSRGILIPYDDQRKRLRELEVNAESPRKRTTPQIDLSPISLLLKRVRDAYQPEQVWLFGSRARGEAHPGSDWDLLVVLPDEVPEQLLDPVRAFKLQKGSGVYADVILCWASDFRDSRAVVNTICHAVATEGILIYEQ